MQRVIEVIVSPTGDVRLQTKGFVGGDCLLAAKFLEQALGVVASDVKTSEYYQVASQEQHLQQ